MQVQTRRKRGMKKRIVLLLLSAMLCLMVSMYILNRNLRPALKEIAATRVDAIASDCMYAALLELLQQNGGVYDGHLVEIQTNGDQVVYTRTNNRELNILAALCAQEAQEHLDMAGAQGVDIPLGTITGIPLLSGHGPDIHVQFRPESNINGEIKSEFRSAGINQTLHRVSVRIVAYIAVVIPGHTFTVVADAEAPLVEVVIVGEVPDTYANAAQGSDVLNLVPG